MADKNPSIEGVLSRFDEQIKAVTKSVEQQSVNNDKFLESTSREFDRRFESFEKVMEKSFEVVGVSLKDHKGRMDGHSKRLGKHDDRMRSVERKVWGFAGAATVLVFALDWLKGKF